MTAMRSKSDLHREDCPAASEAKSQANQRPDSLFWEASELSARFAWDDEKIFSYE